MQDLAVKATVTPLLIGRADGGEQRVQPLLGGGRFGGDRGAVERTAPVARRRGAHRATVAVLGHKVLTRRPVPHVQLDAVAGLLQLPGQPLRPTRCPDRRG
jgi:hypothetical protein